MRILLAVCIVLAAGAAHAQEIAGNFDQLRVLVQRGETIHIKNSDGEDVSGKVLDLSPDAVRVLSGGMTREFRASDVDLITASRHGNLATGAKWGFGTGAGFGALAVLMAATNLSRCGGECAVYFATDALLFGGIGAGIGVGVAAMTTSQRVVFAGSRAADRKVSFAPLIDAHRKGAMASVTW